MNSYLLVLMLFLLQSFFSCRKTKQKSERKEIGFVRYVDSLINQEYDESLLINYEERISFNCPNRHYGWCKGDNHSSVGSNNKQLYSSCFNVGWGGNIPSDLLIANNITDFAGTDVSEFNITLRSVSCTYLDKCVASLEVVSKKKGDKYKLFIVFENQKKVNYMMFLEGKNIEGYFFHVGDASFAKDINGQFVFVYGLVEPISQDTMRHRLSPENYNHICFKYYKVGKRNEIADYFRIPVLLGVTSFGGNECQKVYREASSIEYPLNGKRLFFSETYSDCDSIPKYPPVKRFDETR